GATGLLATGRTKEVYWRAELCPSCRTLRAWTLDAMRNAAGYTNLEYRLAEGVRGSRHEHAGGLLALASGAEAGIVVNNNAAAVLLVLATLARGREVLVSRGELVEIGGGFRIPEIMAETGARLV